MSLIPIETVTLGSSVGVSSIPIDTVTASTTGYYTVPAASDGSYGNSTNSTISSNPTPTITQYTGGLPQVTGRAELVVGAIAAGVALLAIAL
jgi:hypothetical protein